MAAKLATVESSKSAVAVAVAVPVPVPDDRFEQALSAATAAPTDESPWERLEAAVVSDENQARQLLDFYRAHLTDPLSKPMLSVLSHRAAHFAADCFGENAPETIQVLRAVLKAAPDADWAFRPFVVALTMAERWPEVLDAYDTRLAAGAGADRRADILEEAARIAKDFTGDHVRAVGYLDQLYRLRPGDAQVAGSLERLLERLERWGDLVAARRLRIEGTAGPEARELRLRVATTLHEKLGQPDAALAEVRALLPDLHEDAPLAGLLERLLADQRASDETRLEALDALRTRHEAIGAAARVPELLHTAIGFATGERLRDLRRECGERLYALGDVTGALNQYVALIALAPEDGAVEDRLRQLAVAARAPARLAEGLAAAAGACPLGDRRAELLVRAARVEDRQLAHADRAAQLYEDAIAGEAGTAELRLETLRRLEELYDGLAARGAEAASPPQPIAGGAGPFEGPELPNKIKRLHALERLAAVEPKPGGKRHTWALAAELAGDIGDVDRALGAWHARLALDAADVEALAAARALLVGIGRWSAVVELLRRRIDAAPAAHQVRADLVEIATIARDRLGDVGRAIDTWREVVTHFGDDDESVGALADLYADSDAFAELAELLSRKAIADQRGHADRLARLADAQRIKLGNAAAAVEWYGRALEVDPAHQVARAGLLALLADEAVAPAAARQLAAAAEKTDSWQLLLDVMTHRLAGVSDVRHRARILEDAAVCAETRAEDRNRALAWLCQALPLVGPSARIEREVLRLAEATGDYARVVQALAETIGASADAPALTIAQLHETRGRLLETQANDPAAASESYAAALALTPERVEPRRSLLRTLARLGKFAEAAALLVEPRTAPDARDGVLLPLYLSLAIEGGDVRGALTGLGKAVEEARGLDVPVRRDLHARIAVSFIDHCQDADGAEAALERALAADPGHVVTLLRRAELQRRHPDRALVETLVRLAVEQPDNLDFLHEAAGIASEVLGDEALALDLLARLHGRAAFLLERDAQAAGRLTAADAAAHAIDETARHHAAAGTPERIRKATALMLDGERLRVSDERRHGWLRRAAALAETALGDKTAAIRIWRSLHEQAPGDEPAREALARLYESERRFADAVALRIAELEATRAPDRRLSLRLEIVRLGGLLEQNSNTSDVLRTSLAERPGHAPTLKKLTETLLVKGRPGELADIYEEQARILEEDAEPAPAAALWADAARLVESALADAPRARVAWQHTVRLDASSEALDALGRLTLAAGEPTTAADWYDRRLAMTEGEARTEVVVRLAGAYLAAGQRHRAIASLERILAEFPRAERLRRMLGDLYRNAQSWEPLARILAEGCDHTSDDTLAVTWASEVAELYTRLGLLERAVPVLERAVRLVPQNEALGLALADGLARCGRLDEARAELTRLVQQAGWRRTRKRASLHQRLAEIARAQGDTALALAELEQASSMDASSPVILQQLAEVAEAAGDLERAERAYRTLLMQANDEAAPQTETSGSQLVLADVLLRLHGIARKRGHAGEADELLDSALAAAVKDPEQAAHLQRGLQETGAHDALARLFEKRLAQVAGSPAEAEVLAAMAGSLLAQGKQQAAFDAQLRALEAAPENTQLHTRLVELARACEQLPALVDRVLTLVERRRRKADVAVATTLLLLAADITERDFGERDRAVELLHRAEEMQPRSLEVLSVMARIARERGDVAECGRVAELLRLCAVEARSPEVAAEALYRAAELELGRAETRQSGLASLRDAVEKGRDVERASALVAAAGVPEADLVTILPLYERIARQSGDESILLDYLSRRADTSDVTLAEVREAVDLAVALHREDRMEPLLMRLADIAVSRNDGREDATWALLELLRIKKAEGDLDAAARVLERAAEVLPLERVLPLARDLAERAGRKGNRRLGAALLERLRTSAPADESVWRPLLDHYVGLNDREGLTHLVAETLPLLPDVAQRNQLRIALARLQLVHDRNDSAAADVLRDVLLDDPAQAEALSLLADYYEGIGSEVDLVDLLAQVFEATIAAGHPDADSIVAAALRLGAALENKDAERAAATYERALGVVPGRSELLKRLLSSRPVGAMTREHAARMEALLDVETGEEAGKLARELASAWNELRDAEGARRALGKGYAQSTGDSGFFADLEGLYREQQDWLRLADLYAVEAERRSDGADGAALLVEAATLRRGRLADVRGALDLLRRARARAPRDIQILEQLARGLVAHGELGAAAGEVRSALGDAGLEDEQRLRLLLLRAKLEAALGDHRAAVTALEAALVLSPDVGGKALMAELEAWRQEAVAGKVTAEVRETTLRLAELARSAGDLAQARRLLGELVEQGVADTDTVRLTWQLAEAEGDTAGAFAAVQSLVQVTVGEAQLAAARELVALAERLGDVPAAVATIEGAFAANPGDVGVGEMLVALYEQTGEKEKLAGLLLDQGNREQDENRRFELLRRAGALAVEAGDGSVAVMALGEALAVRADAQATLLLCDAYVLAGAPEEAAALVKPMIAAHKGKASPALAELHVRMARIAGLVGDRNAELIALGQALDADKKNVTLAAEVADRAEQAEDLDLALKALRLIVAHSAHGAPSVPVAFMGQARIAQRRGETERAVMFARRAAQDAAADDPVQTEARAFLKAADSGTAPRSRR